LESFPKSQKYENSSENFEESEAIDDDDDDQKSKKRKRDNGDQEETNKHQKRKDKNVKDDEESSLGKSNSPGGHELQDSTDGNESSFSPPMPLTPSELTDLSPLEPLFEEAELDILETPINFPSKPSTSSTIASKEDISGSEDESDDDNLGGFSTALIDYDGLRGRFIVETFRDLLESSLDYWQMGRMTSHKDWILTNEGGAMWPLRKSIKRYSPEIVYLKRKRGVNR